MDFSVEVFTDAWAQYKVKTLGNELKQLKTPYYVYFTDNNYYEHYAALAEKQRLSSCMSYAPDRFGNSNGGYPVHPLEGYDYAPDFRLGLVSTLPPEEIETATDYPFISRVVVSLDDNGNLTYGKVYGNEGANVAVKNALKDNYPKDRQFYALVADRLRNPYNSSYLSDMLMQHYEDENAKGHLVAPYIDPWANFFHIEHRIFNHPVTGKEVVLCTVLLDDKDNTDEWGYTIYMRGYSIYHGTGAVMVTNSDSDEFGFVYLNDKNDICIYETDDDEND